MNKGVDLLLGLKYKRWACHSQYCLGWAHPLHSFTKL